MFARQGNFDRLAKDLAKVQGAQDKLSEKIRRLEQRLDGEAGRIHAAIRASLEHRDLNYDPLTRVKQTEVDSPLPPLAVWLAELGERALASLSLVTGLDGREIGLDLARLAEVDRAPLPRKVDREGYGEEHPRGNCRYWLGGHEDWLKALQAYRQAKGSELPVNARILDFGCASGRFLRHADAFGPAGLECWGCDLAPANIAWLHRHLPARIHGFANTMVPHLPFPDNSFELVTAYSVFTHIDALEQAWLLELKRVTKPGGILLLTVHNEATWRTIHSEDPQDGRGLFLRKHILNAIVVEGCPLAGNDGLVREIPTDQDAAQPFERMMFRFSTHRGYNCDVWHSNAYLEQTWGRHLRLNRIYDLTHGLQALCVLEKTGPFLIS